MLFRLAATALLAVQTQSISADALQWSEMSAKAPGVMIATVAGNWKDGAYSAFIKFPPGSKSPLHTHSSEMKVVVVSGVFHYAADGKTEQEYGPGSYILIPAGMPHTNSQAEGALLFVEQPGRFDNKPAASPAH